MGTDRNSEDEVFVTGSSYTILMSALWCIAPLIGLYSVVEGLIKMELVRIAIGGGIFALIGLIYGVFLPRSLRVFSDGSIGIKTTLYFFKFAHVVSVEKDPSLVNSYLVSRLKFDTSFTGRVLILRSQGRWDILLTPQDADGFVEAVQIAVASTTVTTTNTGTDAIVLEEC